jgi:hypothetical protein
MNIWRVAHRLGRYPDQPHRAGPDRVDGEKLGLEACTRIDDLAVTELANWKSLKYVDLQETKVTEKGLQALQTLKPSLTILAGPFVGGKVSQSSTLESTR